MHRGSRRTSTTCTIVHLLLVALLCQGCATIRLALSARERGAPPWPAPPAGQAQLYLFRTAGVGPVVLAQMRMDGEPLEVAPTVSALVLVVAPGPHVLTAGPADDRAALTVVAHAGQTYVVRVFRSGQGIGKIGLEVFDEQAGREAVEAAARAQDQLSKSP
jgi:hypothetical protein